jgi:hypothetical protein
MDFILKENRLSQETTGTVNLKIAQLERRLKLLEQQQALSSPYPDYKARLIQKKLQVQLQVQQLIQFRAVELQNSPLILSS